MNHPSAAKLAYYGYAQRDRLTSEDSKIRNTEGELLVKRRWQLPPWSYMWSVLSIGAMTALIYAVHANSSLANVPMLFLIAVTASAFFLGPGPAIVASILAFLSFDWFFVEPRFQFTVQDPAEWLALCMFLLTAGVTGQLTALLRARADEAQRRKMETAALAEASWAVASEFDRDKAIGKVVSQMAHVIHPDYVAVLLPSPPEGFRISTEYSDPERSLLDTSAKPRADAVNFALTEGRFIGWESSQHWDKALDAQARAYLPVVLDNQVLAVVFLKLKKEHTITPSQRQVVTSLLNHAAVILQRDKLIKSELKAEALAEADRLKTALLSMVSHDFRSPLTSIKASVSSLLAEGDPIDPETQRNLLQGVDHETDRLNKMVGNILDLSRLEAGAWRPRKEHTELAELIGTALDSFDHSDNERIHVTIDPQLSEIIADSVQMVQVFKNLLENATKYAPDPSPIELHATVREESLVIEVLDRGPGLPKGDEEQIFEPFYRAPRLKESSVPGVGIGLALCRGLVEANGGTLTAINREGGGAIFRVTLPSTLCVNLVAKESNESISN